MTKTCITSIWFLIVTIGVAFLWCIPSFAQSEKADSLLSILPTLTEDTVKVKTLNDLAFELHTSTPRKTIALANSSIDLAKKLGYKNGLAKANNMKAIGYWYVGEYDSSIIFFDRSRKAYAQLKNEKGLGGVLNNMGNVFRIQGNYPKAVDYYQRSMKIDEKRGDKEGVAISMVNIGLIFKGQNSHQKSLDYYHRGLKIFRELEHHLGIGVMLGNIGEVQLEMKNYTKAHKSYKQALISLERAKTNCRKVFSELGIADVYLAQNKQDSALIQYNKTLARARECENPFVSSQCLIGIGAVYSDLGLNTKATAALMEAYTLASNKKLAKQISESAKHLALVYEDEGDLKNALKYYKVYHERHDSLINNDKAKDIARLEFEYQLEKEKQQSILDQQKKDSEYQVSLRQEQLFAEISWGVAILVFVIAVAYFILYKKKKRHSYLLEELNGLITNKNLEIIAKAKELRSVNNKLEELSSFKEGLTHMIVHDMKNSLNTIIGISQKEKNNRKMNLISRSGQMMLNLVMNMLQAQKFEEAGVVLDLKSCSIQEVLKETMIQMELFAQMSDVEIETNIKSNLCLKLDKDITVRVLINLLTNAIKHSAGGKVLIEVDTLNGGNEIARIDVIDSGKGISPEKLPRIFDKYWHDSHDSGKDASTGLGLAFCKLAVEAHSGTIEVHSELEKGTTFSLYFPVEYCNETDLEPIHSRLSSVKDTIEPYDQELLKSYKSQFKKIKVYQVSLLQKTIDEMKNHNINLNWCNRLQAAILRGDEKKYIELIDKL